jgi:hypothetical protein
VFLILLTPSQTYSDEFLAETNREEWLWKCRKRQWDKWPQDHDNADNMKSRLVTWGICTVAEFDLRMNVDNVPMLPSFKENDELDQDAIEYALRSSASQPTAAGVGR